MEKKYFYIAAIVVAVLLAVLAPFLASSNPDGLESAFYGIYGAKELQGDELNEEQASLAEEHVVEHTGNSYTFESPLPDYTVPGMDKPGEVVAILAGTLIVLAAGFGIGRMMSRTK
jgi:cobalt/nickel transport protein